MEIKVFCYTMENGEKRVLTAYPFDEDLNNVERLTEIAKILRKAFGPIMSVSLHIAHDLIKKGTATWIKTDSENLEKYSFSIEKVNLILSGVENVKTNNKIGKALTMLAEANNAMINAIIEKVQENGGEIDFETTIDESCAYTETMLISTNENGEYCIFNENGYVVEHLEDLTANELYDICLKIA